jgi:hypothetical protein
MRFLSFALPLAFTLVLSAAEAPPEVDQALRTRMDEFYKLQIDHQFRKAERLIAEESKEFYYEAKKPDIRSYSVDSIQYSDDLKSAVVRIRGKVQIVFPGAPPMVIESVSPANWKLEDGLWCWYFDSKSVMDSPMGKAVPTSSSSAPADPMTIFQHTNEAAMKGVVHSDKETIQFDPANLKAEVITLSNVLPGPVMLSAPKSAAFQISIAKPTLGPTESTQVTITPLADLKERPDMLNFTVEPVGQTVSVKIVWVE